MIRYILAVLSVFVFVSTACAEEDVNSGNYVLEGCQALADSNRLSQNNLMKVGVCAGAITAVSDIMTARKAMCLPQGVTHQQSAMVVSKYMLNHPEELNEGYTMLIAQAFHDAWPCKAEK